MPARRPVDVPIREESIRLGQFLKLADLAETGSDAKELIAAGEVLVNGEPETRRGRQLRVGDVVEFDGRPARVARRPGSAVVLVREGTGRGLRARLALAHLAAGNQAWPGGSAGPGPPGGSGAGSIFSSQHSGQSKWGRPCRPCPCSHTKYAAPAASTTLSPPPKGRPGALGMRAGIAVHHPTKLVNQSTVSANKE
jgi:ribosome-associated protein